MRIRLFQENDILALQLITNVSSSISHKKKLCLYVREFKKILPNTLKIFMNTYIMNTQIFHLKKYDLKGH